MKKKRKYLWWILPVVLVGAAVGALFYFRAHPVQAKASTIDLTSLTSSKVVSGSISSGISATGSVRTKQNTTLTWGISGKVSQVLVKQGDQVKADQILAQVDPSSSSALVTAQTNLTSAQQTLADLQDVTVSQANAKITLINAQTAVDNAQTALNDLNITVTQAQIDAAQATYLADQQTLDKLQAAYDKVSSLPSDNLQRAQALSALEAATQTRDQDLANLDYLKNYTPDATDLAVAQANLDLANAQLVVAQKAYDAVKDGPNAAKVAAAQANIDQIKATLDQQYIRAPFDGTVTVVDVSAGDQVNQGTSAFRIDDTSAYYIDMSVSEVDINSIQSDQPVEVTFDAIAEKSYNGTVTDIGTIGTVSNGVANFTVTALLSDPDSSVRTGMTASATIVTDQVTDVLLVPNKAITSLGGGKVVYVLANQALTPVRVTVGLSSDSQTEVTSTNLKADDVVITNPSVLTATATSTGISSIFASLFRSLGVTTGGGGFAGGSQFGGGPGGNFSGNFPAGTPPAGFPSGGQGGGFPSGNGG